MIRTCRPQLKSYGFSFRDPMNYAVYHIYHIPCIYIPWPPYLFFPWRFFSPPRSDNTNLHCDNRKLHCLELTALLSANQFFHIYSDLLDLPLLNYKNDHKNKNIKRNVKNVAGWPQRLTPIIAVPYLNNRIILLYNKVPEIVVYVAIAWTFIVEGTEPPQR